jgi:class 3 adenylate cyclase/tetratricopeptide (TPR) repeat protein
MEHIEDWLIRLGLGQYAKRFEANFVDLSVLPDLTEEDLISLGVPLGHRRKILRAIADRDQTQRAAIEAPRPDEPERRQLTVMFCDLVGSTALSEKLDPEDMRDLIGAYQAACAGVIPRYEGFISQYLGDGILIYFGYPRAHEDDAERAVRAALEMIQAVTELATGAGEALRVRVGIATGIVVVGEGIGDGVSRQQMAIGPTPNLAARLQSVAEPGTVVVADSTRRLLGDAFALRELPAQNLKGITEPVTAWMVQGFSQASSRFDAARAARLTDFVNREQEVALLLDRKNLSWGGSGQVVVISGEAGIGKSRLTGRFVELISDETRTRLRYQCSPYHSNSALYPFIRQIEKVAGLAPDDPPDRILDKLEALTALTAAGRDTVVPLLATFFSVSGGDRYPPLGLSPSQQRRRTFAVLLDQLEALAGLGPVLMMFEDAHWADATSLELLDLAIDRIRRLPVLLLVTVRPGFVSPWDGLANVSVIELGRLERSYVDTMIECETRGRELPREVMDQIVAKTDGVPLFVEELTKTVLEAGILIEEEGHYRLSGPLPPFAIPATLHDSLMARLDRLSAAKEVAQVGAAIGRQFSFGLLKSVLDRAPADLKSALGQLEAADLIVSRGVAADTVYSFKHALVQDTAYESLLKSRRQVVHQRIADVIRGQFPELAQDQPEIVAHHYTQAGLGELAIEWWTRASEWARSRSAYSEAVGHLQKALDLAAGLPPTPASSSLWLKVQFRYGRTLLLAKGWASNQVTDAFARAKELSAEVGEASEILQIEFCLWYCNFTQGAPVPLRLSTDTFLEAARKAEAGALVGELVSLVKFFTAWAGGDFPRARQHCETRFRELTAAPKARAYAHDLDPLVTVRICLALILWPLGEVAQAKRHKEEAMALAIQKGDVGTLANTLAHGCYFEALCRNFGAAMLHAEALLTLSRDHRLEGWLPTASFYVGLGRFHAGQEEAGMTLMTGEGAQGAGLGVGPWAPLNAMLLAEVEAVHAGPQAGLRRIDQALLEVERSGLRSVLAEIHRVRAELLAKQVDAHDESIEAAFGQAIELAREQNARSLELRAALHLARFYVRRGRVDAAGRTLRESSTGFGFDAEFPESGEARQLLESLQDSASQARSH